MFTQEQKKSLELLRKYNQKTPIEQVNALKEKHGSSDISGPTYAEYLHELNNSNFVHTPKTSSLGIFSAVTEPPNKIKINILNENPTYCGVLFLHKFVA